jgi:hypothetical protein
MPLDVDDIEVSGITLELRSHGKPLVTLGKGQPPKARGLLKNLLLELL